MTRLTFDELQLLNENRRLAKFGKDQKKRSITREKLQEDIAAWLSNKSNSIKQIPSRTVPRTAKTRVFDDEFCGHAKIGIVVTWLNQGPYNNGRRTRLSDLTGISINRIYGLTCASESVRLTIREYKLIRIAMRKIEVIEKETAA